MRRVLLMIAFCSIGFAAPAAADGAGGPVPPMQGGAGASAPGGDVTYIAVGFRGSTLVQRIARDGGALLRTRVLHGRWGVPGVTFDGATTGLSGDGSTLILGELPRRYPARESRFVVLRTPRMRVERRISLAGWYTADAISPNGRWLYLVHYKSPRDVLSYEVLAYDVERGRLQREPIVDPREPDEKMQGLPLSRAVSADGRFAYTLYDRPDEEPFIHALDTEGLQAACIDLPQAAGEEPGSIRMGLDRGGDVLRVESGGGVALALVDTHTFEVRDPAAAVKPAPKPRSAAGGDDGGGMPWAFAAVPLAALAALLLLRRRRRQYV